MRLLALQRVGLSYQIACLLPGIHRACHTAGLKQRLRGVASAAAAPEASMGRKAVKEPLEEWSAEQGGTKNEWQRDDMHVVLVHPQIPQNAGNVARSCAATAVPLHLVGPLGFEIDSRKLKRAGLDYWDYVCCKVHPSWEEFAAYFEEVQGPKRLIAFSKFSTQHYAAEGTYQPGDWLVFGSEPSGLPDEAHAAAEASGGVVKIPMVERHVRSLNLSTSVGIGLFEALRQLDGAVLPPVTNDNKAP